MGLSKFVVSEPLPGWVPQTQSSSPLIQGLARSPLPRVLPGSLESVCTLRGAHQHFLPFLSRRLFFLRPTDTHTQTHTHKHTSMSLDSHRRHEEKLSPGKDPHAERSAERGTAFRGSSWARLGAQKPFLGFQDSE